MPLHQPSMLLVLTPVVLSFLPFTVNAATARNGHVEVRRFRALPLRRLFSSRPTALQSELWQRNLCRRVQQLRSRGEQPLVLRSGLSPLPAKPCHAAFTNQYHDSERRNHIPGCFVLDLCKSHTATQRWREAAPGTSMREFWGHLSLSYSLRKHSHHLLCGTS